MSSKPSVELGVVLGILVLTRSGVQVLDTEPDAAGVATGDYVKVLRKQVRYADNIYYRGNFDNARFLADTFGRARSALAAQTKTK